MLLLLLLLCWWSDDGEEDGEKGYCDLHLRRGVGDNACVFESEAWEVDALVVRGLRSPLVLLAERVGQLEQN